MQDKILSVFYGEDRLPYKDASRETHYPIVNGSVFNGANNVTKIKYYLDRIGGFDNVTWVVVSKLPNGQLASEVLNSNSAIYDEELGEHYVEFEISSYYTTLKGDVYLSVQGYQGGVEMEQDEDTGIYSIYGTPTIQATGSIKIGVNYAPQTVPGPHFTTSDLQQVLGLISDKANISDTILVVGDVSTLTATDYNEGQLFYDKATDKVFRNHNNNISVYGSFLNLVDRFSKTIALVDNIATADLNNFASGQLIYDKTTDKVYQHGTGSAYYDYDFLATKVDRIRTGLANSTLAFYNVSTTSGGLYGDSYTIGDSDNATGGSVAIRTSGGQLIVGEPSENNHAATKYYVDSAINDFLQNEYTKVNTTTYPTLDDFLASTGDEGYIYLYPIDPSDETKGYYQYIWENNDWVSLGSTNIDLSGYVEKTTSANKVYATDYQGEQTTISVDSFYEGNIARRDSDNSITVPLAPTQNGHASSKKYVDDSVASVESELDDYAKIEDLENGTIVPSKSLTAKELETISPESGDTQETPFALQGTGTANGTSSVDTGTVGKHIQKQGSVYCVNNQFRNGNFVDSSYLQINYANNITYLNNTLSLTNADTSNAVSIQNNPLFSTINGHKYIVIFKYNYDSNIGNNLAAAMSTFSISASDFTCDSKWHTFSKIMTATSGNFNLYIRPTATTGNTLQFQNLQVIDLTQWFNGNIPQDLLDHPEHWSWYQTYGDYIPYNTGELVASNGRYLVCGGRNVWDEEWETGNISDVNGTNTDASNRIRSKNYIPVIPNQTYYCYLGYSSAVYARFYDKNQNYIGNGGEITNRTFTIPQNCLYIKICSYSTYGGTYRNDITISLYYTGEDYSQYYPYEQPKVYDTGSEELLSTGVKLSVSGEREDIYDYKEPNGLITRRVGSIKLKDLTWTKDTREGLANNVFYSDNISTIKNGSYNPGLICTKYEPTPNMGWVYDTNNKIGIISGSSRIKIVDNAYSDATTFKNHFTDNDYLFYELATTTTEQGTPFSENIEINDFGTTGWYATYTDANTNTLVSIPQGCKIFYPAWYVGFIDTLGQRDDIDWDASEIVSKSELNNFIKDISSNITNAHSNITFVIKKLYKFGNLCSLTLRFTTSGGDLSVGTTLLTLPSGAYNSLGSLRVIGEISGTIANFEINKSAGNLTNQVAIPNGSAVVLTCIYAVE